MLKLFYPKINYLKYIRKSRDTKLCLRYMPSDVSPRIQTQWEWDINKYLPADVTTGLLTQWEWDINKYLPADVSTGLLTQWEWDK